MNIFLVCVSDHYYQNRIFDIHSSQNRDNAYEPFFHLRNMLLDAGIQLDTYDLYASARPEKYRLLFFDVPRNIRKVLKAHPNVDKYLVLFEPETIAPSNWDPAIHGHFKTIFTWDDRLVDNRRYIKINAPCHFERSIRIGLGHKAGLCTMIAGNKRASHPLELYSSRVETVRWFEQHHPGDFDLYGFGWDEYEFHGILPIRALNRIRPLKRLFARQFPSYRGSVISKKTVLERYRFAICYENIRDIPGYITEKIFDCFSAGCVPVYWGAPNITDHIPGDCFIDRRAFKDHEDLHRALKGMSDTEYLGYLRRISAFLNSDVAYRFSGDSFARILTRELTGE